MRRSIAITLVLMLLATNLATIPDTSFKALITPADNLAPTLAFGPITKGTPHYKAIVVGEMVFDQHVLTMDKFRDIDLAEEPGVILEAYKKLEDLVIARDINEIQAAGPARRTNAPISERLFNQSVECFFNQTELLEINGKKSRHTFYFPMRITIGGRGENYMAVFSSKRPGPGESQPFPRVICTQRQFEEIIEKLTKADILPENLPEHAEEDKDIMGRYKGQEEGFVRDVIDYAFDGNAIIKPFFNYRDLAKGLLERLNVSIEEDDNGLIPVEDRVAWLIKTSQGDEISERMAANKIPVRDAKGNKLDVIPSARANNHTVYFFGSILDRERDLAHEIGVMCGLPALYFDKKGRPINEMDERYEKYLKDGIDANKPAVYKLANLDNNLDTRDFASGAFLARVKTSWPWAASGEELVDPFSNKALAYYAAALPAAEMVMGPKREIDAVSLYRLLFTRLFGKNDYRFVLNFFDWLGTEGQLSARDLRSDVFDNENFIKLYFAALLLKDGSAARAKDNKVEYFILYINELFADAPNKRELVKRYSNMKSIADIPLKCSRKMYDHYMATRQFREAAVVAKNMKDLRIDLARIYKGLAKEGVAGVKTWSGLLADAETGLHYDALANMLAMGLFDGRKMKDLLAGFRAAYEHYFIEAVRHAVPAENLAADMKAAEGPEQVLPDIPRWMEMFAAKETEAIASGIKGSALPARDIDRRAALGYFADLFYKRYGIRPQHVFGRVDDSDEYARERARTFIDRVLDLQNDRRTMVLCEQAGVRYSVFNRIRPIVSPGRPVTLHEMMNMLNESEDGRAGLLPITGLESVRAVMAVLKSKGLLKAPEPIAKGASISLEVVYAGMIGETMGKGLSREDRFNAVRGMLALQHPALGERLEEMRPLVKGESLDELQDALNDGFAIEIERRIMALAFGTPGNGGGSDETAKDNYAALYETCRSKLYEELDFRYVLEFFEWVMEEGAAVERLDLRQQILNNPKFLAMRDISKLMAEESSIEDKPRLVAGLVKAINLLPKEYTEYSPMNHREFARILKEATGAKIGDTEADKKPLFIFSKGVSFDNGLLPYLGRIAESRVRVAAIYSTKEEKLAIDAINYGKPKDQQIIAAGDVLEIPTTLRGSRCYYFKLNGERMPGDRGISVTDLKKEAIIKIIDALGALSGIDIGEEVNKKSVERAMEVMVEIAS